MMFGKTIRFLSIVALLLAASPCAFGAPRALGRGDASAPGEGAPYLQLEQDVELEKIGSLELFVEDAAVGVALPLIERIAEDEKPSSIGFTSRSNGTRAPPEAVLPLRT